MSTGAMVARCMRDLADSKQVATPGTLLRALAYRATCGEDMTDLRHAIVTAERVGAIAFDCVAGAYVLTDRGAEVLREEVTP